MTDKESPITPTVGRQVLVRGQVIGPGAPYREFPASVTQVHSQNCIDVEVFGLDSGRLLLKSLNFDGDLEVEVHHARWRWMDYQVLTAKAQLEVSAPASTVESAPAHDPGSCFGWALDKLKDGARVTRSGWNGKGMWLYLVPAASYPAQTQAAKDNIGPMVPYGAYLAMKTAQGVVVPWLASQTDVLAEDWSVVNDDLVIDWSKAA
jgi:hypothetical protein